MSSLSLIPEEKVKMFPNSSKSTESLYSTSSSKYSSSGLFKRKAGAARQAGLIPATNEVRQRVLSARRLRMKTLQNQLVDAQHHIAELANENRILRTLHKRQDSALSKYESTNAELPQLLHSHAEEIRIWQTKYRNLMGQNKELANKLKQKDAIILNLTDQNKHLSQLNKDKNLEDRERLTERVRYLEDRLVEKDNDLKLLSRRLQLESKSFKTQLQSEHSRYREVLSKLERVKAEISNSGHIDLESLEKLPKNSLIPRSVSGGRVKKSKSEIPQSLLLPHSEVAHLPAQKPAVFKTDRDRSESPRGTKGNERASAPASQRPSFLNNRLQRRRSGQKDDLAEAIKKGMTSLQQDDSLSDDEYEQKDRTEKRTEEKQQVIKKEIEYNDLTDDESDGGDDEDTADVIVTTDIDEIRRKMSDDYKDQESLLDSFCKDASVDSTKQQRCKSPQLETNSRRANIDPKKKVKLLAALKAIDEDKGEEDK